mgnify:CR=1 FL=1
MVQGPSNFGALPIRGRRKGDSRECGTARHLPPPQSLKHRKGRIALPEPPDRSLGEKGGLVGVAVGGHIQRRVEGVRFGIKMSAAGLILENIPRSAKFAIEVRARKRNRSPAQIFRELSPYVVMIDVR